MEISQNQFLPKKKVINLKTRAKRSSKRKEKKKRDFNVIKPLNCLNADGIRNRIKEKLYASN